MERPAASDGALGALATEKYVRLTTFRRDGRPVATPVWVVADDERPGSLLVITTRETGKIKRLAHTPRVLLAPCDARGRVTPGATEVEASAVVLDDASSAARVRRLVTAKYRLAHLAIRVVHRVGGLVRRARRRPASVDVAISIRPAGPSGG